MFRSRSYYGPYGPSMPAYSGYGAYRKAAPKRVQATPKPAAKKKSVAKKPKASSSSGSSLAKDLGRLAIGAGKMLPGPFGLAAGLLGKVTGLGAYKVHYNSIMEEVDPGAVVEPGYVPVVANKGSQRTVRIRHREYVNDMQASTNFVNNAFQINPANENLFPWLSEIAINFQEYRFHGLVFEFVSLSGDSLTSTDTALGSVVLSTNYNAADPAFASKSQAENSEFTVSAKPSCTIMHAIECEPSMTVNNGHLYVSPNMNGSVPAGQDIKTYNLGNFQFITQGMQAAGFDIGELWVSYDIELIKPTIPVSWAAGRVDHWYMSGVTTSGTQLLGSAQTQLSNSLGCTIATGSGTTTVSFPASLEPGMIIRVDWEVRGSNTSVSTASPSFSYSSGFTSFNCLNNSGTSAFDGASAGSATLGRVMFMQINNTHNPGTIETLTLSPGSVALPTSTSCTGDFMITVYPSNFA